MSVLGLDIGGANLKLALSNGTARTRPFALWKRPHDLANELRAMLDGTEPEDTALTMTAELCDCFATKAEGVRHVLTAVASVRPRDRIRVWTTEGRFQSVDEAMENPRIAAASNWLALATFAGRFAPVGRAVLLDIGSTTTDIVPIQDGVPVPLGRTDSERLRCRELLYSGVRRTPLCALLGVDFMAEFFATTHDVYVSRGQIPSDAIDCDTADSRPADIPHARARLARMMGADLDEVPPRVIDELAERIHQMQLDGIAICVGHMSGGYPFADCTLIISGSGDFLAEEVVTHRSVGPITPLGDVKLVRLADIIGRDAASAACAYAVAVLAAPPQDVRMPRRDLAT